MLFYARKLMVVGINFLPNNKVLEYVDLSSLQEYNRFFLDSSEIVKKRFLGLC